MSEKSSIRGRHLWDEVSEWPFAGRVVLGITVIPLFSFYVATAPTVFLLGHPNEYQQIMDMVLVVVPTILGNLAAAKWSRSRWPHLLAPVVLLLMLLGLII